MGLGTRVATSQGQSEQAWRCPLLGRNDHKNFAPSLDEPPPLRLCDLLVPVIVLISSAPGLEELPPQRLVSDARLAADLWRRRRLLGCSQLRLETRQLDAQPAP